MKIEVMALSILLTGSCLVACTNSATDLPPGEYEKSTSRTTSDGTTYTTDTDTKVEYDSDGRKKATVESKTTKDPKGLFNKSTSESKTVIKE